VTDVAGAALRPAVDPAAGDDPGPDAGPDLHDDDVVVARRDAGSPLAEGQEVDVVVDPDRGAVAGGESLPDRVAVPAGHDRRRDRPAGREFDGTRHADPDPPQPAGHGMSRRDELVEQLLDALEARLRTGLDRGGLVAMGEDLAVERRQRDVDARGAQVSDEKVARGRPE
jgi:hypothetical protein